MGVSDKKFGMMDVAYVHLRCSSPEDMDDLHREAIKQGFTLWMPQMTSGSVKALMPKSQAESLFQYAQARGWIRYAD